MFSGWILSVKNLFLPIFCQQCGMRLLTEENGFFCPTCWDLSPRVRRPFCTLCGRPHQGAIGFGTVSNFPCAECRERGTPPPYRRIYGAAEYRDAVENAIKLLKFHDKVRLVQPLGALMAEFAQAELDCERYDYLTPVPLHRIRLRDRGFNQSGLLTREILPVFPKAQFDESLRRIRPTRVQSRLTSPEERRANVVGAFAVEGNRLAHATVLLIDDVVTTGGTISECAAALRRAGATYVDVLAAALAVSPVTANR